MHPVLFQLGPLVVPSYGAVAALGVLLALGLAQWTARSSGLSGLSGLSSLGSNPAIGSRHAWNMIVLAVFAALAVSRLLLIVINLSDLRRHPAWLLTVAMVHHPLLAAVGILGAIAAVLIYIRWFHLPLAVVADCLAAPVSLGLAAEQFGALLAGSDYGRESTGGWSITYTSPLAARWSGTPLGVALYPVQAYAALGALALALLCALWFKLARRPGDIAGVWLAGLGVLLCTTEMFRDWEGRGVLLGGLVDIPQLVGLGLVLAGGAVLLNWKPPRRDTASETAST